MSLNDIKMPPQLIVGLYPDSLVETELTWVEVQPKAEGTMVEQLNIEQPSIVQQEAAQPNISEPKSFDFQGKNRKQVLILTTSDKAQYLPENELKFLISVLKACGLTIEDVAILNISNQTVSFTELQSFFKTQTVLLFDLEPDNIGLPMNFPQFQLQNFNKCTYLHAPALYIIEKDKGLKMKLWGCLKNLFSL